MKIMRKIIGILAVLLLCTAFVGAGAAFTYSSSDAVVTPSGALKLRKEPALGTHS